MAAPLEPHVFTLNPERQPYCITCNLPEENRIHTVQRERSKLVLTFDHESSVSVEDIVKALTDLYRPYRDVTLFDIRVMP